MKARYPVLLVVALGFASVLGQDGAKPKDKPAAEDKTEIDVLAENKDLRDVLEEIGQKVGRNIIVEPGIDEKVTITLTKVQWREAVNVICIMLSCSVVERGELLVVVRFAKARPCEACSKLTEHGGLCPECQALVRSGGACVVPLDGFTSPKVEGDVSTKLEYCAEVEGFRLSFKPASVFLVVAPGTPLSFSALTKRLEGTGVTVARDRPFSGKTTLLLEGAGSETTVKAASDALGLLKGLDHPRTETRATFRVGLGEQTEISQKALAEALGRSGIKLVDVELAPPPEGAGNKK